MYSIRKPSSYICAIFIYAIIYASATWLVGGIQVDYGEYWRMHVPGPFSSSPQKDLSTRLELSQLAWLGSCLSL